MFGEHGKKCQREFRRDTDCCQRDDRQDRSSIDEEKQRDNQNDSPEFSRFRTFSCRPHHVPANCCRAAQCQFQAGWDGAPAAGIFLVEGSVPVNQVSDGVDQRNFSGVEEFRFQIDDDHRCRAVSAVQNFLPAGGVKGLDLVSEFFALLFRKFLCVSFVGCRFLAGC